MHNKTLNRLYYENNQHYAAEGGYKVTIISKANAKQYMSRRTK